MLKLLKINSIFLFIISMFPWFVTFVYGFDNPGLNMIFICMSLTVFLIWSLRLDAELMKRIPLEIRPSNTGFLFDIFLIYLGCCVYAIFVHPDQSIHMNGLAALPFGYFFYTWFFLCNYLSKLLSYSEEEKEVPFNKRVGVMILFFFFFIGIWWLQPRIKRILDKPEIIKEKYVSIKESGSLMQS